MDRSLMGDHCRSQSSFEDVGDYLSVDFLATRAAVWLTSSRAAFFFGCFFAREAWDWRSEYVCLRSLGMGTVSHTPIQDASPVDLKLHHYRFFAQVDGQILATV